MVQKKKRKPLSIVSKSAARIAAVQIIYNILASSKPIEQVFNEYFISFKKDLENQFDIESLDVNYLESILSNFDHSYEKIIEGYLTQDWKLDRMSNVDKAIIFTGITELKLNSNLSKNIIISEYIEIAQQMSGESSFINKVLDKFSESNI
mgnify:FL=1